MRPYRLPSIAASMVMATIVPALLLTACNDEGSPAVPTSSVSYWKIAYSPNMPAWMSGTEGSWYFDFPNENGVHYVYKVATAVRVGQTITMHFAISPRPIGQICATDADDADANAGFRFG